MSIFSPYITDNPTSISDLPSDSDTIGPYETEDQTEATEPTPYGRSSEIPSVEPTAHDTDSSTETPDELSTEIITEDPNPTSDIATEDLADITSETSDLTEIPSSEAPSVTEDETDTDDGKKVVKYICKDRPTEFFLSPHPNNCNLYISCDHAKMDIMKCPDKLHFNPIIYVCDYPSVAGCQEN